MSTIFAPFTLLVVREKEYLTCKTNSYSIILYLQDHLLTKENLESG